MLSTSSHIRAMSAGTMSTVLDFIRTLPANSALLLCNINQKARIPAFAGLPGDERYKCTGQFCGHLVYEITDLCWC